MQRFPGKLNWLVLMSGCAMTCAAAAAAEQWDSENAFARFDMETEISMPHIASPQQGADHLSIGSPENEQPGAWVAVAPSILDDMRGGFAVESGLKISFGIERTISINGNLITAANFNFKDGGTFNASRTGTPGLNSGMGQLIQNGLGNTFEPGQLSQAAAATFIQNSLNNQTIQSLTIINATSNSLDLLKGMNLHSSLHDALTNSAGAR